MGSFALSFVLTLVIFTFVISIGAIFEIVALLARGVPTGMVVYPNEGHGIRQPRHREDVLRRTLAWFEKHSLK